MHLRAYALEFQILTAFHSWNEGGGETNYFHIEPRELYVRLFQSHLPILLFNANRFGGPCDFVDEYPQ